VTAEVGTKLLDAVRTTSELDPQVSDDWYHAKITVHPRAVVEDVVNRLMKAPLDELARRIGWPARSAGRSRPSAASSSPSSSSAKVPAGVH
jgi:hypothetical protein